MLQAQNISPQRIRFHIGALARVDILGQIDSANISPSAKLVYVPPAQLNLPQDQWENFTVLNTLTASTLASLKEGFSNEEFPRDIKENLEFKTGHLSWKSAFLELFARLSASLQATSELLTAA